MIKTHTDGMHYTIPQEWASKLDKYDKIVKVIAESTPYSGNRDTCNKIRQIIMEKEDKNER